MLDVVGAVVAVMAVVADVADVAVVEVVEVEVNSATVVDVCTARVVEVVKHPGFPRKTCIGSQVHSAACLHLIPSPNKWHLVGTH